MKIAVVGPGAIGATVAAHLSHNLDDLTVCVRTAFDHLVVDTPAGRIEALPHILTRPDQAQPVEWVQVATHAYDVEATALWLARLVGRPMEWDARKATSPASAPDTGFPRR